MNQGSRFKEKSKRARNNLVNKQTGIQKIDQGSIIYCKADDNYTHIVFSNKRIIKSKVLKYFESTLSKDIFIRPHKSFLINRNCITGIRNGEILILVNNIEIPISRRKRRMVNQMYSNSSTKIILN